MHDKHGTSLANYSQAAYEDCCYLFFGERHYSWIKQWRDISLVDSTGDRRWPLPKKTKGKLKDNVLLKNVSRSMHWKIYINLGIKQFTFGDRLLHTNSSLLAMKPQESSGLHILVTHLGIYMVDDRFLRNSPGSSQRVRYRPIGLRMIEKNKLHGSPAHDMGSARMPTEPLIITCAESTRTQPSIV